MPADLHPRLLRGFVATAETLHFGRAAAQLHTAQQALSRDIRTLEGALGEPLFHRTTRSVELTQAGVRLLPKARQLLALHDEILGGSELGALLVDVNSEASGVQPTPVRVLEAARAALPGCELLARFHGGLTFAASELVAHRLDVSFGRFAGLGASLRAQLTHTPVRLERMAVFLPVGHPLASLPEVPVRALDGYPVDVLAGNPATTEWTDLGRQLLAEHGLVAAPAHPAPVGAGEFARYLARHGEPVLTTTGGPEIPGSVTRPLVDPVPLSLLGLVHRPRPRHPGVAALLRAARELGAAEGWLRRPRGSWLPREDAALLR